ncbi:hypothetical protein [Blastococcus haudaquaticus]|uniref:Uncharacterized protein n=1 Tax=Blastococcus haudaquaticus TaxID=1938745 RepID=A0A286GZ02_9ACTN|nr:hypothetical protein [Blastococcus haudaquaticus]SOE00304.1 hypothetical protein SAMN06272739_2525 [Blastococcus haudaquaticus]
MSRVHRHRAPGSATRGATRLATARTAVQRSRARIILVLGMACAALLVAAPLALFLSGGPASGGSSRDPEGVFTGDPNTGVGGGPGPSSPGVVTGSSQSPAPGDPPVDTAADGSSGGAAGGAGAAAGGEAAAAGAAAGGPAGSGVPAGSGSGGSAVQPGTAAGQPAGGGGWTAPAQQGQQPASQQPAQQQPTQQQPTQQQPTQQPAPQQPEPQPAPPPSTDANGVPCPCTVINGVLTSLSKLPGGLLGQ